MENKFYTDNDFEHFLKDATDNFRMYPSKKVWHSIYNDLHPSRKWPSLAVCLLLVAAILFVGVSNNNSINQSNKITLANNLSDEFPNPIAGNDQLPKTGISSESNGNDMTAATAHTNPTVSKGFTNIAADTDPTDDYYPSENSRLTIAKDNIISAKSNISISQADATSVELAGATAINNDVVANNKSGSLSTAASSAKIITRTHRSADDDLNEPSLADNSDNISTIVTSETVDLLKKAPVAATNTSAKKTTSVNNEMSTEDKAWIENFAFNNKAAVSRFKLRSAIQYYVTPSVGFRFLKKNNGFEPANPGTATLVSAGNVETTELGINDEVTQKSAINLEAGFSWLYNASKKIRLKAGLQLNYTSYISFADALKHPSQTYLLLNTTNGGYTMQPRTSNFANSINGEKSARLNNKTVQLSLPIGADVKLAGRQNLKWYAGATIQPSIVTGGKVYAVSADTKNYVEDNSLLRKWNMSAGVETFISYKTPSGITINAGPQVRYQFKSTYTNQYSYSEKLYNIGVKLGITKSF